MAEGRLVYSTDGGDQRRRGRAAAPAPAQRRPGVPDDGVVRVFRDRSGRKGKVATVVTGLPGDAAALRTTCAALKRLCGSGGAVKDGAVEIQGDHRERVAAHLEAQGHRVRLAGG
jgi:translation initiation factor 1